MTRARGGDSEAFRRVVEPYRRELHVHCYRMLGSFQDAEDALQETLLSAWRGLGGFEGNASMRTWLYRVATNRCLNALRAGRRRPTTGPPADFRPPEPTRLGEVSWLEPYPDVLLDSVPDGGPGPDARYESREAISLGFVTALQLLPRRQRAVLVLRDVLGFRAQEVADLLETSTESVASALKRARAAVRRRLAESAGAAPPPVPGSTVEQELVAKLTRAFEAGDVDAVVALLTEDAWLVMPPLPLEYHGRERAAQFHATVTFRSGRVYRVVPTRANGQPAFGAYLLDRRTGLAHANGIVVLTLAGERVAAMTRFDNSVLAAFGLPRTLPG
jgi:RNA polymerase sigma-70 factor (ECF subfamily)